MLEFGLQQNIYHNTISEVYLQKSKVRRSSFESNHNIWHVVLAGKGRREKNYNSTPFTTSQWTFVDLKQFTLIGLFVT